MKSIQLRPLVVLGMQERFLLHIEEGSSLVGNSVQQAIRAFVEQLDHLPFPVTRAALSDLIEFADRLDKQEIKSLTATDSKDLRRLMEMLEHTLLAEAQTQVAYVASSVRFDVVKLTGDTSQLFSVEHCGGIPFSVMLDVYDGGRAIAFGLGTAAAFHMMRATEGMLREYYHSIVKRGAPKKELWANLVDGLRKRRSKPKPSMTLLDNLDHLRRAFRNPTAHPDAHYDRHEAEGIFALGVDVIGRMAADKSFKARGVTWSDFLAARLPPASNL